MTNYRKLCLFISCIDEHLAKLNLKTINDNVARAELFQITVSSVCFFSYVLLYNSHVQYLK